MNKMGYINMTVFSFWYCSFAKRKLPGGEIQQRLVVFVYFSRFETFELYGFQILWLRGYPMKGIPEIYLRLYYYHSVDALLVPDGNIRPLVNVFGTWMVY
jgi:hypothetical protein